MAKKTDSNSKPATPAKRAIQPTAKLQPATVKPKRAAAKAKAPVKSVQTKAAAYTLDDVALRAYFIAEKRRNHGLHGDEHQDWVEAERQLAAENGSRKKARKA